MTIEQLQNVHIKPLHRRGPFTTRRLEMADGWMLVHLTPSCDLLGRIVVSGLKMGAQPLVGIATLRIEHTDGPVQHVSVSERQNKDGNLVFNFETGVRCFDADIYLSIGGDRCCSIVITMNDYLKRE